MSVIETLKKIEYQNLAQFTEDINKNFGIVQNSPLYRGIPGEEGENGPGGLRGLRGSKFIFINLPNFQTEFPNELSAGSQIDINYINTKLLVFENKQKLFSSLSVTDLVDKDVIVLTNTIMLSYDSILDKFTNTGISFNEQSNLLNNIQQQVENYVQYYIGINQTINNISNIFEGYSTLAKNYADTNNTFITTDLTSSSVYSPFIPGFNSNIGISINNHKYFGFSDAQYPISNNGTTVFGSMKKYYQLLMATIGTDTAETLTSDYAPGVGNLPSAVFLQDTEKAGILFGYKSRQNLKRFGSLFKNELHEVVIKTDTGVNPSEYAELKIHRTYLKFDKLVQFGNDLEVSRDVKFFADISNKFLRSGKFSNGATQTNSYNPHVLEVGRKSDTEVLNTIVKNVSDFESYAKYVGKVFVTDNTGLLSKNYSLENAALPNTNIPNLTLISEAINSEFKVLTSNYYGYLARKINAISTFVDGNYWRKNQFYTGEIPDLRLNNRLEVGGNTNISNMLITDVTNGVMKLGGENLQQITTKNIKYDWFAKKVLIVDSSGIVSNKYELEINPLDLSELAFGVPLTIFSESEYKILSTKYYAHLAKKINGIATGLATNYYTIDEFTDGSISNLTLSNGLLVTGGVSFVANSQLVFNVNPLTGQVNIGTPTTTTVINSSLINFGQYINKVLVTDNTGNIINDYSIENNNFNDAELVDNTQISLVIAPYNNTKTIARGYHVRWITRKINALMTWLTDNVWYKPQWITGEIPSLLTNTSLKTNGEFRAGDLTNPNLSTIGNETYVGKLQGNTEIRGTNLRLRGRPSIVAVTDSSENVSSAYSLETLVPNSGPGTGATTDASIFADYWNKTAQPQIFQNFPFSPFKVVTSNYIKWCVSHFIAIRTLLFDRPTYTEVEEMVGNGFPLGGIVYWNNAFGSVPAGWVVCDGRWIPGIPQRTPNMIDKFVKGSLNPNITSGSINNLVVIGANNIPPHTHHVPAHTHNYYDIFYSEDSDHGGNVPVPGNVGSGDSDTNNAGIQMLRTTLTSGGGYTGNNTSTNAPINIEPYSISLIPIMKFWNGVGTVPSTVLPAFANITGVVFDNISLKVTINLTYVDTTVTAMEVYGSNDAGVTWNLLKVLTTVPATITNVLLPNNGDWVFRVKATNGDSSFTTGEYSNNYSVQIVTPFALLPNSATGSSNNVSLQITKYDNSVTSVTLMRSDDNINFVDVGVFDISGTNMISDTTPANQQYYYKIRANNGNILTNNITDDEISNVCSVDFGLGLSYFALITNISLFIGTNSLGATITTFLLESNKNDSTVTNVRFEYFNPSTNQWTSILSTVTYPVNGELNITRLDNFDMNYKYRLRALNGTSINSYSNDYQT